MIEKLTESDFPDSNLKCTVGDKTILKSIFPTTDNMEIIVDKINELIKNINDIQNVLDDQEEDVSRLNRRARNIE
jgi:methyl-accepting chemotaxis protein